MIRLATGGTFAGRIAGLEPRAARAGSPQRSARARRERALPSRHIGAGVGVSGAAEPSGSGAAGGAPAAAARPPPPRRDTSISPPASPAASRKLESVHQDRPAPTRSVAHLDAGNSRRTQAPNRTARLLRTDRAARFHLPPRGSPLPHRVLGRCGRGSARERRRPSLGRGAAGPLRTGRAPLTGSLGRGSGRRRRRSRVAIRTDDLSLAGHGRGLPGGGRCRRRRRSRRVLGGRRRRRHGGEFAFRRRLRFECALGARRRELQGSGGARIAGGRRRRRLSARPRGAGLDLPGCLTGLALGGAGRGHGGCLLGSAASRKQAEWVDVAVLVGGDSNAEVDVWFRQLGLSARTDRSDRFPLDDGHALGHGYGPEVDERHRVAVGGR